MVGSVRWVRNGRKLILARLAFMLMYKSYKLSPGLLPVHESEVLEALLGIVLPCSALESHSKPSSEVLMSG